jgi:hypothetical protein
MLDNDENYIQHMSAVVESVDEYASMEIAKACDSYYFRIAASHPRYNMMLLEEILKLNNLYKLKLNLSKSIKSSGTLSFNIAL